MRALERTRGGRPDPRLPKSLPPGRELDRVLHEELYGPPRAGERVPAYSRRWSDARKLRERCGVFAVQQAAEGGWSAIVAVRVGPDPEIAQSYAPTRPLAVTRAALRSLIAAAAEPGEPPSEERATGRV